MGHITAIRRRTHIDHLIRAVRPQQLHKTLQRMIRMANSKYEILSFGHNPLVPLIFDNGGD